MGEAYGLAERRASDISGRPKFLLHRSVATNIVQDMEHPEIIARLGGYRAVATALSVPITTAHTWTTNGIPHRRWPAILDLAASIGVALVWQDLLPPRDADKPAPPAPVAEHAA